MAQILLSYDGNTPVEPASAVEAEVWDAYKTKSILDSESGTVKQFLTKDLFDVLKRREETWRGWNITYPKEGG